MGTVVVIGVSVVVGIVALVWLANWWTDRRIINELDMGAAEIMAWRALLRFFKGTFKRPMLSQDRLFVATIVVCMPDDVVSRMNAGTISFRDAFATGIEQAREHGRELDAAMKRFGLPPP